MLQRWPWHRPARRNSSRPDDSKISRVATRHGHSDVPVAYCYGRTTICKASSATSNGPGALSMPYRRVWPPRKSMACQENISLTRHLLLSGGAVRRNSLCCAPFGPPTVSCVLAPARTCLRQAPPTSRGRGLATSAVPHHLTDDMAMKSNFTLEKRCKKTPFFTPFQKIETNGVKSGRFLHRLSDTRIRSSVRARFLRDACPRRAR